MTSPDPTLKQPLPGDSTGPYAGSPPAGGPTERPPVDLVPGSGPRPTEELRALLHRRLATITLIGLCGAAAMTLILMPFLIHYRNWRDLTIFSLLLANGALCTALLWGRRSLSLRTLRGIELAFFGVVVVALVWHVYARLYDGRLVAFFALLGENPVILPYVPRSGPADPEMGWRVEMGDITMWALAAFENLGWFALLIAYGTFIPNTWRRCTAVVGTIGLVPVLLHGVICLTDPAVSWLMAGVFMLSTVWWVAFGAAIAVFGSHRIERLRQEALAARKLGQYQLKEKLGAGGMGEVYLAEHVLLRRPCALKLIRPERAGDPKNLLRFEREVRAMATLTSWHTAEVFDYGHAADGTFYYVMEYLPGLTLEELVARHGPLSPGRAVHLLRQVCAALHEAHGIGLIHRDIKPGNIIVGTRGGLPDVAKLLDFGLVLAHGPVGDGAKLTQEGTVAGTPAYMSPEQAAGADGLDARSDIYSLGAVAYFLLTGRPPFVRKTGVQVLAAHLHEPARWPDEAAGVPADLRAVVLRCLEKDPARRFPDADALERALAGCGGAGGWTRGQAAAWWREHAGRDAPGSSPEHRDLTDHE
jgi:eukaryotic-like serine/threonine-protein kinase